MIKFAENLKVLREKKGLTTIELAGEIGLSGRSLFSFEKGTNSPSLEELVKIADFFGVTLDGLVFGKKKISPDKFISEYFK